jgi:anti-sigma factor RsiW
MTCADVAPLLAAEGDGSLDASRRDQLDAHLAACGACRRALEEQTSVAALLAQTLPADVGGELLARVNARIDREETVFGFVNYRAWTLRLAPVALALVLAALFAAGAQTPPTAATPAPAGAAQTFTPASLADWERDVSANALLEAALPVFAGGPDAR